mmetsp:Transcript_22766/g.53828  ORF Transcript_22766/g.53828 Transcript_22766/m.53828 type:complete len:284 (+) Transcript_22766:427-1278(+)
MASRKPWQISWLRKKRESFVGSMGTLGGRVADVAIAANSSGLHPNFHELTKREERLSPGLGIWLTRLRRTSLELPCLVCRSRTASRRSSSTAATRRILWSAATRGGSCRRCSRSTRWPRHSSARSRTARSRPPTCSSLSGSSSLPPSWPARSTSSSTISTRSSAISRSCGSSLQPTLPRACRLRSSRRCCAAERPRCLRKLLSAATTVQAPGMLRRLPGTRSTSILARPATSLTSPHRADTRPPEPTRTSGRTPTRSSGTSRTRTTTCSTSGPEEDTRGRGGR